MLVGIQWPISLRDGLPMNDDVKKLKSEMDDQQLLLLNHNERHRNHVRSLVYEGVSTKFHILLSFAPIVFITLAVLSMAAWIDDPRSFFFMTSTMICILSGIMSFVVAMSSNANRWLMKMIISSKLLFSPWKYKDVERALSEKNFAHPALQKLYPKAHLLRELSQEEIQKHHSFFSNQDKQSLVYTCWMSCLARPSDHPIREMDVEALYVLAEKEKQCADLIKKTQEKEKPDDQFEQRQKLLDTVAVDHVEVLSPTFAENEALSSSLLKDQYKNI